MAFEPEFTVVDAKSALIDLLNAYQGPKYQPQLEALRGEAGDDMIKQMQIVFPVVAKIQAEVIHRYGFSADGEGVIQFMQHIKLFEREDPEIARLFSLHKSDMSNIPTTGVGTMNKGRDSIWLSDEKGHVYVTVNTSQAVFPEVSSAKVTSGHIMDWNGPTMAQTITIPMDKGCLSTKLDTLAHAASTQLPMNELEPVIVQPPQNTPLPPSNLFQLPQHPDPSVIGLANGILEPSAPSNRLLCGDCSVGFESADVFFKHWLDNHCKLELSQTTSNLPLQQCQTCHHIFVMGTAKAQEHSQRCGIDRKSEPTNRKRQLENEENVQPSTKQIKATKRPPNAVSCGTCSLNMKTITSFFLHWLDAHQQIADILEEVWQCGVCIPSKLFPDQQGLQDHFVSAKHTSTHHSVLPCSVNGCESKFACEESLDQHMNIHASDFNPKTLNRCPSCPKMFQSGMLGHYAAEHESICSLCPCQVQDGELEEHLANFHHFERVWNRQTNLEKIAATDSNLGKQSAVSKRPGHPANPINATLTVIPNNPLGTPTTLPASTPVLAAPTEAATPAPSSSTAVSTAPSGSSSGMKCKSCSMFFTSEKLLEKHYFANHEFKCKFCDKTMDKDEYGDHLRVHLASERKKTVTKK